MWLTHLNRALESSFTILKSICFTPFLLIDFAPSGFVYHFTPLLNQFTPHIAKYHFTPLLKQFTPPVSPGIGCKFAVGIQTNDCVNAGIILLTSGSR